MPTRLGVFLALASIYNGGSRGHEARLGSVTVQIVRHWVVRRGAEGLIKARLLASLRCETTTSERSWRAIEREPSPYLHDVGRERLCDRMSIAFAAA